MIGNKRGDTDIIQVLKTIKIKISYSEISEIILWLKTDMWDFVFVNNKLNADQLFLEYFLMIMIKNISLSIIG